jgi:polar amino acid transport system substrate-binding protein
MKQIITLSKIIASVCFLLTLSSCGKESDLAEKDAIIVATSADNPPYEYIQDGKIVGLDIDIITAIAKEAGKKIVIKNFDFPALLPSLATKNVDLVIAALTMTDARKEHIDFSNGYFSTTMSLMFKKGDNFKSIEDLRGKVIGVQSGTTWESYAKEITEKFPDIRIRSLYNNLVLIEELKVNGVDALIMEEMQVQKFSQNVENLDSFQLSETKSEFAIALPKNSELTDLINNAIKALQESGELKAIQEKWMK